MPTQSERNPPIPSSSKPSLLSTSATPLRRPSQPQNDQIMPPMNGTSPTSPFRRAHHRSISHPFPFATLGKKRDKAEPKNATWDSDSDSDEVTYPAQPLATSPRKDVPKGGLGGDLAEGKCQTCNSTVRWPRHLNTYRCTTCLMVTDLDAEPPKKTNNRVDPELEKRLQKPLPPDPPKAQLQRLPNEPRPDAPLSIGYTRRLIDGCLSAYFQSLLDGSGLEQAPNDKRTERDCPDGESLPSSLAAGPKHDFLSAPAPRDPRSRSTSISNERDRFYGSRENTNLLTPNAAQRTGNEPIVRTRANSDLQKGSTPDHRPQMPARHTDPDAKDKEDQPLIFKRLENYIISAFKGCSAVNVSFPVYQQSVRSASSGNPPRMKLDPTTIHEPSLNVPVFEPDAKTLLLGDVGENSTWWMHEWAQTQGHAEGQAPPVGKEKAPHKSRSVSSRSPRINWTELNQWYQLVLTAGSSWADRWASKRPNSARGEADTVRYRKWESIDTSMIEKDIYASRLHLQRALMKASENLLKRPRKELKKPEDTRFLLILLANPLLSSPLAYSAPRPPPQPHRDERRPSHPKNTQRQTTRDGKFSRKDASATVARPGSSNHHYGILKRILGLMSNLPNDCHHYFVSWFARFTPNQFERLVELAGGFVTYRLIRQHGRKRNAPQKDGNELIPSFASASGNTPAELHAAISRRQPNKAPPKKTEAPRIYAEDWQIRAASRIMSLLFTANTSQPSRKPDIGPSERRLAEPMNNSARDQEYMIPISSFYNTLLDYSDLVSDFEIWESKGSKFSFCQYPFFLSIWAKIHILEHDARRQMEVKAREAFFNSILNSRPVSQFLVLKVRRECLAEDSLRGVSEVVGSGQEEIKKGLRIEFVGEEGIDAGGLRKEWFLLLVREVFDPHHGLFIYDDDSKYCYFNPFCFESSEQFFLVGVLLGLAIYNSTILDVDLPPFAFRKLLASAPQTNAPQTATFQRPKFKCTLEDLAEYRPALAKGLRMLLEYEGDVAETFCYDFVAQVERYGEIINVPLCAGGEKRPVTNSNRREFVDAYIYYLLDTAVARQYEPFKRGFFTVCGGNALSLFRAEEIELLVRGSDEPLDVTSLRAVASYDNWSSHHPETIPVVQWFWDLFETAPPASQRKILSFITGSDRIPAMGATSLSIRLACLGDDSPRYPTARTCFNTLSLYRYASREKFQRLLWDAVTNSEGFGLK
ncbi:hypothetical protein N7478_004194 [Penicillium angulare]|uniref:uncharacterized protein n=1 Tax=Penicillium angulare TaxID=116970 RepID=UPI002541F803|nr:uncharacterized protein N7478_004194 [Penicillium angulare]KAJ5278822.1 hypothetical protein N7478_004194 [Penicillium angulare]